MISIGVDIGGTNLAVGFVDGENQLVWKDAAPFPGADRPLESIECIERLMRTMLEKHGIDEEDVQSIGLAVPGSIDYEKDTVINAYNLGYHDFPLVKLMRERFPRTHIYIENDANAAALAEYYCGAFRGYSSGLLITLGTGVGGGFIYDGKLFVGGKRNGFEFGHGTLVYGGKPCTCGARGCIESYCSATALAREGARAAKLNPASILAQTDASRITAKVVIDCAKAGDRAACAVLDAYTRYLGAAVATAVAMLDPEVIALGGGVSNAGELLLEPIRAYNRDYAFFKNHARIVCAEMRNDAGLIGAAMLHLQRA